MTTTQIVTAIVTLIIFIACLALTGVLAISGLWMPAVITGLIAAVFGYFVRADYLKYLESKKK